MKEFQITGEYIQLNQLLKASGLAWTGGHAKMLIDEGMVQVNGETEYRLRNKLRPGDVVLAEGETVKIVA